MTKFYDLVRVTTATTGMGTITLGSAVSGFRSFSGAGVSDGASVRYGILDGANSEVGIGVYSASGGTLTRTVTASTNSNSAISLSGTAQVFITLAAEDFNFASLSDVDMVTTAPASGRVPTFNGTNWVPAEPVAHAAPTQVQIATNIGNRVISATNSATLASAPTVGNTLLAFVSGLAPGSPVQSGWTTLGSYSANFQQIYVYSRIVAAGDPSTWSFANSGDYMNVAVIELSGVLSLAATVGSATDTVNTTLSSPGVSAATPAIAYNMFEFANNTTLSSEASGWTLLGFFGEATNGHEATLIKTSSAFSTVSPAAPSVTFTSDPSTSAVYATVVVCGKLTTKLGDLYDSNAAAAADGQVLKYNAATNEWLPATISMTSIAGNPGTSGSLTNDFALCFSLSTYSWNWAELATVAITGSFTDLANKPTNASYSLHGLSDVNVTEGSGINGYVLTWNNATNKWIASAASGGGSSTLSGLSDVNVTEGSGINGYVLTWNDATSKWIASAASGGATAYTHYRCRLIGIGTPYNSLSLTELWVLDGTATAKTPTAAVASLTGAGAAANLYDGSTSTDWESASNENYVDISFTYATAFVAGSISLTSRNDSYYPQFPTIVVMFGSNDGSTWSAVGVCYPQMATSAAQAITTPIV